MDKPTNMDIRKKFGENLRLLRKSRGYSQMRFAEVIGFGVTQAAVSSWEIGLREPEFSVVFAIANTFHVPVSSLLPLEESGADEDIKRKVSDLFEQNPRLIATIEKLQYFDEKQIGVVMSVVDAIAKESDAK